MSLLVLSPDTVVNQSILSFSTAPRKILQRGMILPRRTAKLSVRFRFIVESQLVRYAVTLSPFLAVGLIWRDLALALGSAPVFMLAAIGLVEMRLLRIPVAKRGTITTEAEAARTLDTLTFRGRRVLTELAARRGMDSGTLYLVIEQSDLVRIPPLTIVSLQSDTGKSRLIPVNDAERAVITEGLFDADFTEEALARANQREGVFLRSVAFEARSVSAHARLAAFLDNPPQPAGAVS